MGDEKPSISLVYPMFNERKCIVQALNHAVSVLPIVASRWEIIVVDDGSTDGCGKIADHAARSHPNIRIVKHAQNRGLGKTLRDGFAEARHEVVLYSDADLPYDLSILKTALPRLKEAELIAGYRLTRRETAVRFIYSKVYNALIRLLFGLPVRDVNFSFKLFKRSILDSVRLESEGSFIDAELLIKVREAGFAIGEVGVVYLHRRHGLSKLSSLPVILKIFQEGARQWLRWKKRGRRPRKYPPRPALWDGHLPKNLKDRIQVRARWKTCPFEALEQYVPAEGRILDYGCGHGIFSCLLAERAAGRVVTGFDPDARKIGLARQVFPSLPNLSFVEEVSLHEGVCYAAITLIDVLAYLPAFEKQNLLRKLSRSLIPGGILMIKEMDTRPLWKHAWTTLQELAAVHLFRLTRTKQRGKKLFFEKLERYEDHLKSLLLQVEHIPLETHWLYPHVLIIGRKTDETADRQRG